MAIEKAACVYCSYANGLIAYIAEIAARTALLSDQARATSGATTLPLRTRHATHVMVSCINLAVGLIVVTIEFQAVWKLKSRPLLTTSS
jgi:hypothetical protein